MLNVSFRIHAVAVGVVLCSSVALAQPRPAAPGSRRYPLPTEPRVYDTFQQKIKVTVVAHGIQRPWSLLPLPDGDFLVGVRPTGQVLAIRKGVLDPKPLSGLPAMHITRTTGMLDMVLHPKFADNKWVYFTYHKPLDGDNYTLALARGRYDGSGFSDVKDLYVGNAVRTGGSRLTFGPDGLIYITVGGAGRIKDAQELNTHLRQDAAVEGRRDGAQRQSVCRKNRRPAGDLHARPSRSSRDCRESVGRTDFRGGARTARRRQDQHPRARPQLRLAKLRIRS